MLYKKFRTKRSYFLYDTYSNRFFRIEKKIYDNFEEYLRMKKDFVEPSSVSDKDYKTFYYFIENNDILKTCIKQFIIDPDMEEKIMHQRERLTLDITYDCNNRCYYCAYSGKYAYHRTHQDIYMSFEIAKKAIKEHFLCSDKSEHSAITYYGGEPSKESRLVIKFTDFAKSLSSKFHFGIATNGLLLTDELVDYLVKNEFTIQVSIDGPKDLHDRYRRNIDGNGTYNEVITRLKHLTERYPGYLEEHGTIIITLTPDSSLLRVWEWVTDGIPNTLNINHVNWMISNVSSKDIDIKKYFPDCDWKKIEEERNYLKELYLNKVVNDTLNTNESRFFNSIVSKRLVGIYNRKIVPLNEKIAPSSPGCIPAHTKVFVDPYGNYYTCERVNDAFKIGSVETGVDIKLVEDLMTKYVNFLEFCNDCWAKRLCQTCFSTVQESKIFNPEYHEKYCPNICKEIEEYLSLLCSIQEKKPGYFDKFDFKE